MKKDLQKLWNRIVKEGGVYDARKYRYIIDTRTGEIKRTLLSNLDTTAMLRSDTWEIVK